MSTSNDGGTAQGGSSSIGEAARAIIGADLQEKGDTVRSCVLAWATAALINTCICCNFVHARWTRAAYETEGRAGVIVLKIIFRLQSWSVELTPRPSLSCPPHAGACALHERQSTCRPFPHEIPAAGHRFEIVQNSTIHGRPSGRTFASAPWHEVDGGCWCVRSFQLEEDQ